MPVLQRWHSGDIVLPDDKERFVGADSAVELLRALEHMWQSVRELEGEPRRMAKEEILAMGASKRKECPEAWVKSVSEAFGAVLRDLGAGE